MHDDVAALTRLNAQVGLAEAHADRAWLAQAVAPRLAFRRASGAIVDRDGFLADLTGGIARSTVIESVMVHGSRAVVGCIVTQQRPEGAAHFHNLRLLVRVGADWKLLGWANERL